MMDERPRRGNLRKIWDSGGSLHGYRDGYAAGHAAATPVVRFRPDDYAGAEPIPSDPNTPEGRYRINFRIGWLDGYQDGRALVAAALEPLPDNPPPSDTIRKPEQPNGGLR